MDDRHARHRRRDGDPRRRPTDGYRTTARRFRRLSTTALAALPTGLRRYLDRVRLSVEDIPPEGDIVLARFEHAAGAEPGAHDRVILYRRPLETRAGSRNELSQLIQEAVVEQLASAYGIDDERLEELGW